MFSKHQKLGRLAMLLVGLTTLAASARSARAEGFLLAAASPGEHAFMAPSLRETGRVAGAEVARPVTPAAGITGDADERAVPMVAEDEAEEAADDSDEVTLPIDPILASKVDLTVASFEQCRVAVARRRHVRPSEVQAGTVKVRWTIEAKGGVRDSEVVTAVETDVTVAACVKRVVASADLTSPDQRTVTLERRFTFR